MIQDIEISNNENVKKKIKRITILKSIVITVQVPYYIDDDVKLTQTFAILKYLGRKHNLVPRNEAERIRVDLIEAEAMDMRNNWVNLCYMSQDFVRFT